MAGDSCRFADDYSAEPATGFSKMLGTLLLILGGEIWMGFGKIEILNQHASQSSNSGL